MTVNTRYDGQGARLGEATGGKRAEHDRILASVTELLPAIRERAPQAEEMRRLPDQTIEELEAIDFFRLHVPAEFGGFELDGETLYAVARLLSQACCSTAWTSCFLAAHAIAIGRYSIEAQREVFGDRGYALSAGSFHPLPGSEGKLVDGGLLVSGRWDFCSGILHSDWCFVDVPLAPGQESSVQRYTCLFPVSEIQVHDVWQTTGMRGTGSNDVSVEGIFVPQHRMLPTLDFFAAESPGSAAHPDYAFLKVPFYRVAAIMHAAFVNGSADRFLEVFRTEVAPRRMRPVGAGPLIDAPLTHSRYAAAEQAVHVAGLLSEWQVQQVGDLYGGAHEPELDQRALLRLSSVGSIVQAAQAVELLTRVSGGSMFKRGSELDRIRRDVSVMLNHNSGDWDFHSETAGRILLGLPADSTAMTARAL